MLTMRAVKLTLDGALGSRGAAMHQDYSDEPGHRGLLLLTPEEYEARVRAFMARGFQVCTHAIGDRANTVVLDVLTRAAKATGTQQSGRHRVEHAQIMRLEDIDRLSPTEYAARVRATVGPLKARFSGKLLLLPEDAPRFYILHAQGSGGLAGAVKGEARITLEEVEGHTHLSFTLAAALGGAVGRMAVKLVQAKADRVINGFFERFTAEIVGPPEA